jgi:predicted nucleic acid-binding Zn ribbon protein
MIMALVNCKECNKEISSSAKVCPECGNPIAEKRKEANNRSQMILILIGMLLFLALYKLGLIDAFFDKIKNR